MNKKDIARADRIIQIFRESELTQSEFSKVIGVSQQLVSAVLNYRKKPNESILFGIIDNVPKVDPLWLLLGKETKTTLKDDEPLSSNSLPLIQDYLNNIVLKRIERLADDVLRKHLSDEILKKLSNIEEIVKENYNKTPN